MKRCPCCGITKETSEFHKNKSSKNGLQSYCKECQRGKGLPFKSTDKILLERRKFYQKHREEILDKRSKYREENRDAIRDRVKIKTEKFFDFKRTLKCEICGYNKCIGALDFHHTNPEEKERGIGNLKIGTTKKLDAELSKCTVLCKNCHYELHWKEEHGSKL